MTGRTYTVTPENDVEWRAIRPIRPAARRYVESSAPRGLHPGTGENARAKEPGLRAIVAAPFAVITGLHDDGRDVPRIALDADGHVVEPAGVCASFDIETGLLGDMVYDEVARSIAAHFISKFAV